MSHTILKYNKPACEWVEGLPLGNGTIGAMFFGLPGKEQMTLNHDRLFRKKIVKDIRTAHLIPEMRKLIFQKKHAEADRFFLENMGVHEGITNPYQVFCALQFDLRLSDESWDYERSLDLSSGIARIAFRSGGRRYSYEGFVSEPEQALFVRVVLDDESADDHSGMDCDLVLWRVPDEDCVLRVQYKEARMILTGEFVEGVRFATLTEVNCSGGSVSCEKDRLIIRGAKEIFLCQVFATNYTADDPSEDCVRQLESTLVAECSGQPLCDRYENHKTLHITENRRLFDRMDFQLDGADSDRSSDESYNDIEKKQRIGQELYVWLFNMGRYCLMSSSRPGSYPMNLQGVWNDRIDPLFESGYTTDMNIQMQYWAALPLNLSECELPVFQWLQDSEEILRKQAKNILGTGGYYVPQYTDIHFTPASQSPYAMFQLLWIGAAPWLGQHFFEYWKYTGDDRFARDCAYPYLKQCAEVFKDWLVRDFDGKYRSVPSYSPENMTASGSWSVNTSTMDITIIRELFSHLRQIDHALELCDPDREWWDEVEDNLPDYPFDKEGNLKEWTDDFEVMDPYHRHISHIYGIFPGKLFSLTGNPKVFEAAVKAIHKRREGGYSQYATWSHAWFACCFARIGHGDEALESIKDLMKSGLCSNFLTLLNDWRDQGFTAFFTKYKLLQTEALLGATAAIAEMLVQSFDDEIQILPALPHDWSGGSVKGLRAYGGFEISIVWKDHCIERVELTSSNGGDCLLRFCRPFVRKAFLSDSAGDTICAVEAQVLRFPTVAGDEHRIITCPE